MGIRIVDIYRAGSIGDIEPPLLTIQAHTQIQDDAFSSLQAAKELYAKQAAELAGALFNSLPGGTIDALLVEMMRRKVSLFSVPL